MPGNMAVEWPNAGIIRLELQDDMSARSQHLCVSTLWILGIYDRRAVPGTVTLSKDLEIMPMCVKWLMPLALRLFGRLENQNLHGRYLTLLIARFAR